MTDSRVAKAVTLSYGHGEQRRRAGRSKFLPVEDLVRLANGTTDLFGSGQMEALQNPNLPEVSIMKFFSLLYNSTRAGAAPAPYISSVFRNPSMPAELINRFMTSFAPALTTGVGRLPHSHIIYLCLQNPNCPPEWLEYGAKSQYKVFRSATGQNPNLPVSLQKKLLADHSMSVRRCVVENPIVSPKLLAGVVETSRGSQLLAALAKRLEGEGRRKVVDKLDGLQKAGAQARRTVARFSESQEQLTKLAYDSNKLVRAAVAGNEAAEDDLKVVVALLGE